MGYERIYTAEIDAVLDRVQAEGAPMIAAWITQEVCAQHEATLPPDDDPFWRHCGYANTRDAVRRRINARAADRTPTDTGQAPLLPGYEHLQRYYLVKRRGVGDIGVPIHQLTDREIDGKVGLYERFGFASLAHAEELREFKKGRRARKRRNRKPGPASPPPAAHPAAHAIGGA